MSRIVRAALCAALVWAALPALAASSASAEFIGYRWSVVDLKPGDDASPGWNGYTRENYSAQVCLANNAVEQCWYDEYNWFGDPQHVSRSSANAAATAANAGGSNHAFDPPVLSESQIALGSAIAPASGAASFRAMTGFGYGAGIEPWTAITFEADVMLFAAADTPADQAAAYASITFLSGVTGLTVGPSSTQGLHTLRLTVSNYTDEIDWSGSFRIYVQASGSAAAPVPEPAAVALLLLGLAAVHRQARRKIMP